MGDDPNDSPPRSSNTLYRFFYFYFDMEAHRSEHMATRKPASTAVNFYNNSNNNAPGQ
jgi:hypothetical protein